VLSQTTSVGSAGTAGGPVARVPVPAAALSRRSRDALLSAARQGLAESALSQVPGERYALAHLAGLRAAAAVLAVRARPRPGYRGRPASAWRLLAAVAPELSEWAAFYAAGAGKRAAAEAGLPVIDTREADDLLRQTGTFVELVEVLLGLPVQGTLPATVPMVSPLAAAAGARGSAPTGA
jgi:hypothetical protein